MKKNPPKKQPEIFKRLFALQKDAQQRFKRYVTIEIDFDEQGKPRFKVYIASHENEPAIIRTVQTEEQIKLLFDAYQHVTMRMSRIIDDAFSKEFNAIFAQTVEGKGEELPF